MRDRARDMIHKFEDAGYQRRGTALPGHGGHRPSVVPHARGTTAGRRGTVMPGNMPVNPDIPLVQQRWDKVRDFAFEVGKSVRERKARPWMELLACARKVIMENNQRRMKSYEKVDGLDYALMDNEGWRHFTRNVTSVEESKVDRLEGLMVVIIGMCTGLLTKGLMMLIDNISDAKLEILWPFLSGNPWAALLVFIVLNTIMFCIACVPPVFINPLCSGGGIPEVKSYLNGCHLHGAFSLSTLWTKFASVTFACTASMPVGPEAPIIHLGACVGAFFASHTVVRTFGFEFYNYLYFRKVVMTLGVAAGVSAAFGAPIGGLLFTNEEILALKRKHQWYAFIASLCSYTVLQLMNKGEGGIFVVEMGEWNMREMPFVFVLGLLMGVAGVAFNKYNVMINREWRKKHINAPGLPWPRGRKVLEVAAIAVAISITWHLLSFAFACVKDEEKELGEMEARRSDLWCAEGYWNPFSSVLLQSLEAQVRQVFTVQSHPIAAVLTWEVTLTYGCMFAFLCATLTGCHVASGIFIPMFVIGGHFGRTYGYFIAWLFPHMNINVAAYAVIGVAGFLGGVTQMAVALSVVLLEITDKLAFLLPIMVCVGTAKTTASYFTEPLFDVIIHLKHIPFLEDEPTRVMHKIRCYHAMNKRVKMLPLNPTVREVVDLLNDTSHAHNGFPVVDSLENKRLRGLILRSHLTAILNEGLYLGDEDEEFENALKYTPTEWRIFCDGKTPKLEIDNFTEADYEEDVNLSNFMSRGPPSVISENPVARAFDVFRNDDLRHLPVVDEEGRVVGMMTRHDLVDVQHHGANFEHLARERHMDGAHRKWMEQAAMIDRMRTDASTSGNRTPRGGSILKKAKTTA
jgi:chloride channel 7